MTLEEAILDKVRRLPPEDQERVLDFADSLRSRPKIRQGPYRDRSLEMQWLAENRTRPEYANQWVAIEADSVVAAGTDGLAVYNAAKSKGVEVPFIVHIVPQDLPWGGW